MWFNFLFYILMENCCNTNTLLKRRYFQLSLGGLSDWEASEVAQYDHDILSMK